MPKKYTLQFAEWSWQEYQYMLLSLIKDFISPLKMELAKIFPVSEIIVTNSARGALIEVLVQLKEKNTHKTHVLVSEYICPSVLDAIKSAGLEPVSVAMNSDLNISATVVEENICESTLAVIGVHMCSKPCDIQVLENICKRKGVILIDDAAQLGFGNMSKNYGAYGDFGLISFAQSKSIVTGVRGSGGVLLINNDKYKNILNLPLLQSKDRWLQFFYFLLAYKYSHIFGKLVYYYARLKAKLKIAAPEFYQLSQISNIEASIALAQYQSIENRVARKTRLLEQFNKKLISSNEFSIPQFEKGIYLSKLLIKTPLDVQAVRKKIASQGVQTRSAYPGFDSYFEIPFHSKMSDTDVVSICNILKSVDLNKE